MRKTQVFISLHSLILLTACALTPNHFVSNFVLSTPTATQSICQPSQTQLSKISFPEIQAKMKSKGEIWALLFFDKAHAKKDEKIVWRIEGASGQFTIQAQHEDGTIIHPIWGPEYHPSSNWDHPGDEWGTGFNFPESGCWTLSVTFGDTSGEIYLDVVES